MVTCHQQAKLPVATAEMPIAAEQEQGECEYADKEWRKICLRPIGQPWQRRLQEVFGNPSSAVHGEHQPAFAG